MDMRSHNQHDVITFSTFLEFWQPLPAITNLIFPGFVALSPLFWELERTFLWSELAEGTVSPFQKTSKWENIA